VNEVLGQKAVVAGQIDPSVVRTDTTVTDANIHWPTDSSLLWDTWRVASLPRLATDRPTTPGSSRDAEN